MSITLTALQKQRRDTAANWTTANPTLLAGEIGIESDTGYWKVGDGSTAWTSLAYLSGLGAEIPVSRLADGTARQLLQTDAAGTGVEWASNIDVPGTLDVTGAATFDNNVTVQGDLTVNGTTTTIDTTNLAIEDKNIEIGKVATPTDVTADGGGITLKGTTDKTISWVDATDAWTFSEHVNIASGKEYRIAGTKVLDATSLGSGVLITSANITDGTIVNGDINAAAAIAGTKVSPDFGSQTIATTGVFSHALGAAATPSITFTGDLNTGIYSPGADQVAVATNGTGRLFVGSGGQIGVGTSTVGSSGNANITIAGANNSGIQFGRTNATAGGGLLTSASGPGIAFYSYTGAVGSETYTEAMRIDSSNRVGIGTTTVNSLLEVRGTTDGQNVLHLSNNAGAGDGQAENQIRVTCNGNTNWGNLDIQAYQTIFTQNGGEKARIDPSGRLLVGTSSARNVATHDAKIQLEGVGYSNSTFQVCGNQNNSEGAYFFLGKSRGTTVGSNTIVQANDELGTFDFFGTDGSAAVRAARIGAYVDGTPGTNDMPGRLVFSTTKDGQSSPDARLRVNNFGNVGIVADGEMLYGSTTLAAGTTSALVDLYSAGTVGSFGSGTRRFLIFTNGNVQNSNGSYGTLSDAKLKENIVDASSQWDDLKSIQIRNWNFKAETGHETHRQIGPIAQELETICPGLVFETPDRDEDGNDIGTVTKGVNQSVLYMKAVKALQEAMERIEQLEAEMAEVKAQLS
jgi:hypothetical protein